MAVCIFSRRGIHVRQGRGEITALFIPSHDQIAVYRDTSMTTADVAQRSGSGNSIPLWREVVGNTVFYGTLPTELTQARNALRVWLASDFAPTDAEAFFFLFENRWLVHGVRETDDEGRQNWRTTVLNHEPETIFQVVADNTADLMLSGTIRNITVAVDGDLNAYSQLRELLAPLQLSPVPFSILKPAPRARLLYRHRDFTLAMMISVFFLVFAVGVTATWWVLNSMRLATLQSQVEGVRQQIAGIQISDNLGQVQDPDQMLDAMKPPFVQQPSAIIDAAARIGAAMGKLKDVTFQIKSEADPDSGADSASADTSSDIRMLTVSVESMRQKLLVNQEQLARTMLPQLPWVRKISSIGGQGEDGGTLRVMLQIDSPAEGEAIPSATTVVDVAELAATNTISETGTVSSSTAGEGGSADALSTETPSGDVSGTMPGTVPGDETSPAEAVQ